MGDVVAIDDGFGLPVGTRYSLPSKWSGSHVAYAEQSRLIVEWYDHGNHAPYESANLLIFDRDAQLALISALSVKPVSTNELAIEVARRFDSYFRVRKFADEHGIAYQHQVDFQP